MANIFESYSMDFTTRIQHAQREDGQWFTRHQYRDARYGYKWSAWRASAGLPESAYASQFKQRARLPK